MAKKVKAIDKLLGMDLLITEKEAIAYIMGGRVYCNNQKVRSPGQLVLVESEINIRGLDMPYIGKGGLKLAGAIKDFEIDINTKICIDAGACTGGFTDCLIKHGAERVYAVEVGYGQLAGSLRQHPNVINLEKTNISDESLLHLNPLPVLGTVDLSYLSLRKALPVFYSIMQGHGELICLVKPLFETEDADARRTGRLCEDDYEPILIKLINDINAIENMSVINVTHSPVTGNHGTIEFFLHVAFGQGHSKASIENIGEIVARAKALALFKK